MTLDNQLDGIFDDILATPVDLAGVAFELAEIRAAEWVDADGGPSWGVLLRATALMRTVPQLLERVRLLESIAAGELEHLNAGSCPSQAAGFTVRDADCRACPVLGRSRTV